MMAWQDRIPGPMARRPRDPRGFPIPWCAQQAPVDLRLFRPMAAARALTGKFCFMCGEPLYARLVCFVIGACDLVTRTAPYPPCHPECARWAAMNAGEIGEREMGRPGPDGEWIEGPVPPALVAFCRGYELQDIRGVAQVFGMLGIHRVDWFDHGRPLRRCEALAALERMLPGLEMMASDADAVCELEIATAEAMEFLPKESC